MPEKSAHEHFIHQNSLPNNHPEEFPPLPFGLVVDRAVELYSRRWRLYAAISLAVLAVQTVLYMVFRTDKALTVSEIILAPIIVLAVTIGVWNDLLERPVEAKSFFARCLNRAAAVVVIDLLTAIIFASGYAAFSPQSGSASYGEYWLGGLTIALYGTLVFADVCATVTDGIAWYALVPFAFYRSISLAWQGTNIFRVLLLVALQIPPLLVTIMLEEWMRAKHVFGYPFFSSVPLTTLLAGPFQALFTVAYFDALARERQRRR